MKLTIAKTIVTVTASALMGMILGGAFGYFAGLIAPDLFEYPFPPWNRVEPIPAATVLGSTGGVFCGGALGSFAVVIQFLHEWSGGCSRTTANESQERSQN